MFTNKNQNIVATKEVNIRTPNLKVVHNVAWAWNNEHTSDTIYKSVCKGAHELSERPLK